MATTTHYINTDIVGGTGSGDSPVNAYSSLITALNSNGGAIATGDIVEFDCIGTTAEAYSGITLDLLALSYTGAGLLRFKGYAPSPWLWDTSSYRIEITNMGYIFQTLEAVDLEFEGFQFKESLPSPSDGKWGMFADTTDTGYGDRTFSSVTIQGCFIEHTPRITVGDDAPNALFECRGAGTLTSPVRYVVRDTTLAGEIQDVGNSGDLQGDLRINIERCSVEGLERMFNWSSGTGNIPSTNMQAIDCAFGGGRPGNDSVDGPKSNSLDKSCYFNCAFQSAALTGGSSLVLVENTMAPALIGTYFTDPSNGDFSIVAASPLDGTGSTGNNIGSHQTSQVDTSSPFPLGLPESEGATNNTITTSASPNETSDFRIIVLSEGAPAPTTVQALAGLDSGGAAAIADSGLQSGATEFINVPFVAAGLDSGTTYDFYIVTEDVLGNQHLFTAVPMTTTGVDSVSPVISSVSATSVTATTLSLNFSINEAGDYRYVIVANGDTAPTATEVLAGQESGGGAPLQGNILTAHTSGPITVPITGLAGLVTYDIYIVAQDAIPNVSLVTLISPTTTTPGAKFTGTLRDWQTDVLNISDPEVELFASTTLGGAPINSSVVTFTTDGAGVYSVNVAEATAGVEYWVQKRRNNNRVLTLNKQTAEVI